MKELTTLDSVERYINGELSPEERVRFEALRKTDPELDQAVVEHTFFLQQFDRYGKTKNFRQQLNVIHNNLSEKGFIRTEKSPARIVSLFHRYKRTAAIAASIAGITALGISVLVSSITPSKPAAQIEKLSRDVHALKLENRQINREIEKAKQIQTATPVFYKTGGTGFLVDAGGVIVTNAHVIKNAKSVAVQNSKGKDLPVSIVFVDVERDIALLQVNDSSFKTTPLPYSIRRSGTDVAEPVFTLGFPRNDMVYGEGYLAAKTGFNGDTLTYQIAIAANPGNSGGPIMNKNGEVIGILSTRQVSAEGVVFATQSRFILDALKTLRQQSDHKNLKLPAANGLRHLDRVQQVKKMSDFVYLVKVS